MIREILQTLSLKNEHIFFSFPGELVYITFYEQVSKDKIQSVIDKDIWLAEIKLGHTFIEQSDCQVKVLYREKETADLTCIYYPKKINELVMRACHDNHCELVGLGINIFNASEIAKHTFTGENYIVAGFENNIFELVNVVQDKITGYARFSSVKDHLLFYANHGDIPEGLPEALTGGRTDILDQYKILITGNSSSIDHLHKLKNTHANIRVLNPMSANTSYIKPSENYNEQYDTVFTSALGAMI
ncbi:MAG: hypothetical protein K0B52_03660 [FCB group bacterium]|nr:hypothetical protein [FCB group bacterium]